MMPPYEERFPARDGLQLYYRRWLPPGEPAAVVVIVHGVGEHGGRYAAVAEKFCRHGYAAYALDLRGHGNSAGDRVLVAAFAEYLDDLDSLLDRLATRHPDLPVYLLGHSMGGAVVTQLALRGRPEIRGLILSAAALRIAGNLFPLLRKLAGLFSRLMPRLRLVRLGSGRLSRDPQVIADFRSDPLVFHDRFPVRTGAEILQAAQAIQRRMESIELPLLILHGTGDFVTDPKGSWELYTRARSADRTLKLYQGLYHDLLHEPEWEQITDEIVAWLGERCRLNP
jgi:alpha-beta hydrolase superfamily lysophospholipase